MKLLYAILASFLISLISLIGIFSFFINNKLLDRILFVIVSFAAGSLIGVAFLHILVEVVNKINNIEIFYFIVIGFVIFFILEKYFYWRHCHKGNNCKIHPVSYLNLIGDSIHNFFDGIFIGSSFVIDVKFGVISTIAVMLHEIPQEFSDFGILLFSGFSRNKALTYNFLVSISAIFGSIIGYFLSSYFEYISIYILPIIAGGFIYIAACDLIPELHREKNFFRSILSLIIFIIGIIFMAILKL